MAHISHKGSEPKEVGSPGSNGTRSTIAYQTWQKHNRGHGIFDAKNDDGSPLKFMSALSLSKKNGDGSRSPVRQQTEEELQKKYNHMGML